MLKEKKLLPELNAEVENIVCALDPDLQGAASKVATILREKGQTVDLVLENKPLKWYHSQNSIDSVKIITFLIHTALLNYL